MRVVVADRSLLLRNLLQELADGHGIAIVGETARAKDLVELCVLLGPDVVVSDVELEDATLAECLPALLRSGTRVLALCNERSPDRLIPILDGGATGCLLQDASPQQVIDALRAVAGGAAALDPIVAGSILSQWRTFRLRPWASPARRPDLTPREQQVLQAMVEGLAAKAIARRLGVATKTVENHKIRIFDKLGVRTQAQAVALTISQGLLTNAPRSLADLTPN